MSGLALPLSYLLSVRHLVRQPHLRPSLSLSPPSTMSTVHVGPGGEDSSTPTLPSSSPTGSAYEKARKREQDRQFQRKQRMKTKAYIQQLEQWVEAFKLNDKYANTTHLVTELERLNEERGHLGKALEHIIQLSQAQLSKLAAPPSHGDGQTQHPLPCKEPPDITSLPRTCSRTMGRMISWPTQLLLSRLGTRGTKSMKTQTPNFRTTITNPFILLGHRSI